MQRGFAKVPVEYVCRYDFLPCLQHTSARIADFVQTMVYLHLC